MACFQNGVHKMVLKLHEHWSGTGHAGTQGLLLLGSNNSITKMADARA